ncbi:MAG: hypothetical protein WC788_01375 [Candidatus Paceibacterota bacterium]
MKKYKLRFLKNGIHLDFAVRCEERFNAINKNCFILAIGSGTDDVYHMKIYQEVRIYGEPMNMAEIADYVADNPDMFSPEIAFCRGIALEDDGQDTIRFENKIDVKSTKKTNETKGPPN